MTIKKGVILVHYPKLKSASTGKKVYLIDSSLVIYALQRQGYINADDAFFYPFANKECKVAYSSSHQNTLVVEDIAILAEGDFIKEKPHHARKLFSSDDLSNSTIIDTDTVSLSIVTNQPNDYDAEPKRLYARLTVKGDYIFFRVSIQALELFFDDRITLLELIRLRADELFYQEKGENAGLATFIFASTALEVLSDAEALHSCFTSLKTPAFSKEEFMVELSSFTKYGVIETLRDFN